MLDRLEKEAIMLNRHLKVVQMVLAHEPIDIVTLATKTDYSINKVRYSLRVLEEKNIIQTSSQGVITTDETADFVNDVTTTLDDLTEQLDSMLKA